ncbi:MAG: LptF/LptG family permease [Planctomycetes bacterium]|nr:LptF/LptG family permease [Planctomycetota bacterium]MBL7041671.1 LptF/LptG family permease [Pirellulaceae bacterium]
MNTIKRYVVFDILTIFFVTIAITLLLMTLGGGAKEGIRQGLPPSVVLGTMPYILPEMLRFTIPGCLLFAVCSVFGRMTVSNEIVAIKSLGINPLSIVWPVLVVAYLLSIATFGIYDVCALWSRPNLRRLVEESVDQIALGYLKANGSFTKHGISIVVKGVDGDRLLQPLINIDGRADAPPITLTAEEARLRANEDAGTLRFECRNGQIEATGKACLRFPGHFAHDVVLREPELHPENRLSPAALGSRVIPKQITRETAIVSDLRRKLSAQRGANQEAKTADLQRQFDSHQARLYRLQTEIPRRFSNGFGCLCFALIGIPVAMKGRSSDTMSVFFCCFMPILLVYYPLLVVGENIAREGFYPGLSVWLADAVLLVIGAAMMLRTMRR